MALFGYSYCLPKQYASSGYDGIMNKQEFLNEQDVVGFCNWLGEIIAGGREIHFRHRAGTDLKLIDARNRYSWPQRRIDIPSPVGQLTIRRNSNLSENAIILDTIGAGLRKCLESPFANSRELFEWLRAIFVWGGVFTKRGNAAWLNSLVERDGLKQYWLRVRDVLRDAEDDDVGAKLDDLRSNAGTTKVHSLLLPNWVIYDSRVAAALAWLVYQWSSRQPPSLLQFGCMRANSERQKLRSPDEKMFKYFTASGVVRNHRIHLKWNVRANWVLSAALDVASSRYSLNEMVPFASLRDVEAALFMVGDDLSEALR